MTDGTPCARTPSAKNNVDSWIVTAERLSTLFCSFCLAVRLFWYCFPLKTDQRCLKHGQNTLPRWQRTDAEFELYSFLRFCGIQTPDQGFLSAGSETRHLYVRPGTYKSRSGTCKRRPTTYNFRTGTCRMPGTVGPHLVANLDTETGLADREESGLKACQNLTRIH